MILTKLGNWLLPKLGVVELDLVKCSVVEYSVNSRRNVPPLGWEGNMVLEVVWHQDMATFRRSYGNLIHHGQPADFIVYGMLAQGHEVWSWSYRAAAIAS